MNPVAATVPGIGRTHRRGRSGLLGVGGLGAVLTLSYLLAGRMGGDLSAQMARADFASDHPGAVIDLRWFGGTQPFGYSLWTPPVMALVGPRVTGAVATVAAVTLFGVLLQRLRAPHPVLAGALAAGTFASNLAEGRDTFACGLAVALGALVVLAGSTAGRMTGGSRLPVSLRPVVVAALSIVAAAASPVVALYLLLGAAAAVLARRPALGLPLTAAVIPLAVTSVVFGDSGRQVFSANDAIRAALATVAVGLLVRGRDRVLRRGVALALVMVLVAALISTPIGSNSARLSLLFAAPVVAGFSRFRRLGAALSVVLVLVLQPPVTFGTITGAGAAVTRASYFTPLRSELRRLGPLTGRVEVPELTGHWDAAYLARSVPLSRGWLRQLDTELNDDVFYRSLPTAASYRRFLDRTATQYVAVSDARPTFYGRRELRLISSGLPYLHPVWRTEHWILYAVAAPTPIVSSPAHLIAYRSDRIVLYALPASDVTVRIRWLRWLTVQGPAGSCLRRAGDAVVLRTGAAGEYTITSALLHRSRRC